MSGTECMAFDSRIYSSPIFGFDLGRLRFENQGRIGWNFFS